MRFVTARDLRNKSSEVWQQLAQEKELIITINGRPAALLTPISDSNLESTLHTLRQARAQQALSEIRADAVARGLDKMTDKEIKAEITASRRSRKR